MFSGRWVLCALACIGASAVSDAQTTSPDASSLTSASQTCGSDRATAADRVRACTSVLKGAGLRERDLANVYINRARASRLVGDAAGAEKDLDAAIKADDRYAVSWFERANFRSDGAASDVERGHALEDYDRAIKLKPTYPAFFLNRGNLHKALGHPELALQDYGTAITLDPTKAVGYSNRAGLYLAQGNLDAAIQDFSHAIERDATRAEPFYSRGTAWQQKGDYDKAIRDYDEAARVLGMSRLLAPTPALLLKQGRRLTRRVEKKLPPPLAVEGWGGGIRIARADP